jgi:ClpP class serine protease
LREEEREKLLAALEARFQRMLTLQLIVLDGTVKLDKTPVSERESRHHSKSVELSHQEEEIALEATKAITLLREEGSGVAFPEAVEQMRDDMRIVVGHLQRTEVGELTQAIEKDIIDALQEMIEALQKEMEKKDQKQQPPNKPQDGQQPDPALVDQLAELKMLRSLQLRVNHRTKILGREVQGEQAKNADTLSQLQNLADRQARIQQATYDLATGKNK